jgi:four helix bundle protein
MSRDSILKVKSFEFAVRIIKLHKYLRKRYGEYELSRQIIRSGTSVGAIIREAEHAVSRRDFLHKLNIALKEINESLYWLELLVATDFLTRKMFESMKNDGNEILKMLVASIKTIKLKDNSKLL